MCESQVLRCQNRNCGCEVRVIKSSIAGSSNPLCCCGTVMKKPYQPPVLQEIASKVLAGQTAEDHQRHRALLSTGRDHYVGHDRSFPCFSFSHRRRNALIRRLFHFRSDPDYKSHWRRESPLPRIRGFVVLRQELVEMANRLQGISQSIVEIQL